MARGDGRVQFFEAGIFSPFDFLRDAEGKAAVAQDRADKAQRKADARKAATDESLKEAANEAAAASNERPQLTRTAGGGIEVDNRRQRQAMQKMAQAMRAVKAQADTNAEAIEANAEALLAAREFMAQFIQKVMADRRQGFMGGQAITGALVPVIETWIDIANVGDIPTNTTFLSAAHIIDGLRDGNVVPQQWEPWMQILAAGIKALAYWDGDLTSIFSPTPAAVVDDEPADTDLLTLLTLQQAAGLT